MNWHIIYTKSRYEKKIETALIEKGFEVYCPKRRLLKNWSDRKKLVEEPLFKSYIFILVNEFQKIDVLKNSGVVKFVNFKGEHATIRDSEIIEIKRMLNDFDHNSINILHLNENDIIQINSGALKGAEAKVLKNLGKKVIILIESLGIKLELDLAKNLVIKS